MYTNLLSSDYPYHPSPFIPLVSRLVARNALSIYLMYIRDLDVGELVGEVTRTRWRQLHLKRAPSISRCRGLPRRFGIPPEIRATGSRISPVSTDQLEWTSEWKWMCVCVCVCERNRKSGRDEERQYNACGMFEILQIQQIFEKG